MLLGFNLLLWTTHVTDEHFPLFAELKQAGYDGVELPIFEGDPEHFARLGRVLKDEGLRCTGVTVLPDEAHSAISADPGLPPGRGPSACAGPATASPPPAARSWPARSISRSACSPASRRPRPSAPAWSRPTAQPPPTAQQLGLKLSVEPLEPLRVPRAQHRRRRGRGRARGGPAQLRPALRHLPRQHRGEGPDRRDRAAPRPDQPRPRLGERPRHPRQGPRPLRRPPSRRSRPAAMTAGTSSRPSAAPSRRWPPPPASGATSSPTARRSTAPATTSCARPGPRRDEKRAGVVSHLQWAAIRRRWPGL